MSCNTLPNVDRDPKFPTLDHYTTVYYGSEAVLNGGIHCGRVRIVQLAIEHGAVSNHRHLRWAVRSGHEDIVRVLLETLAEIPPGWLLSDALKLGWIRIAELLFDKGAVSWPGLLDGVVARGQVDAVKLLLNREDARLTIGHLLITTKQVVYSMAVSRGYISIVRLLDEHGLSIDISSD
jgi:hypothetical protein